MLIMPTDKTGDDVLVFPDLEQWASRYLYDCEIRLFKGTTLVHYRNALKRFMTWYATRLPDGRISRQSARDFAYWLSRVKCKYDDHDGRPTEDAGLSSATVRRTVGVVRTFVSWLYEEGYLSVDIKRWFPMPRMVMPPLRLVSIETVQAILNEAAKGEMGIRDITIVALLADTGLRRREIATLQVDQICWANQEGKGLLQHVVGKGDKIRNVPFSSTTRVLLHNYLQQRTTWVRKSPKTTELFVQTNGAPLRAASVYQILRRIARRAGVEDEVWNTHAWRHTFATYYWQVQRDTKSLSMILGHSSQKVTEDIYVHPLSEDLLRAHTSILVSGQVQAAPPRARRSGRPDREQLLDAIRAEPNWCALGSQFGMSDQGVRKLANRYGLLDEYYATRKRLRKDP